MFIFPWSNLHELNLDWILAQVKKFSELIPPMETAVDEVQELSEEAAQALEDAQQALEDAGDAKEIAEEAKEIAEQAAQGTIADGAVITSKIHDDAVTTPKINDGAVTSAKLDSDAVTTVKIQNGAVSYNKLSADVKEMLSTEKHLIIMGDSYAIDTANWTGWITQFSSITDFDIVATSGVGGSGFIGSPNIPTVYEQLSSLSVPNNDIITDIVILGGYNDASALHYYSATEEQLKTAVESVSTYAKNTFRNAKLHYGFIGINENNEGFQSILNSTATLLEKICTNCGIAFIPNAKYILLNHSLIFQSANDGNARTHPNSSGTAVIAQFLDNYLSSGYCDVKSGFLYDGVNFYMKNGEVTAFPHGYGFPTILVEMTYPFNTWTTLADLKDTASNFLWGTHNESTCFKFWAAVFTNGGQYLTHALFRVFDKKIQINPLNSTSGMTTTGTSWICIEGFTAPFESMFG